MYHGNPTYIVNWKILALLLNMKHKLISARVEKEHVIVLA